MPTAPKRAAHRAPKRSTMADAEQALDRAQYDTARLKYVTQLQQRGLGSSQRPLDFSLADAQVQQQHRHAAEQLTWAETAALLEYSRRRSR